MRTELVQFRKNPCAPLFLEKGFTLVEVMISIAIFAIGILAVSAMQWDASKNNRTAALRTMATSLASEIMEEALGLDYDQIVAGDDFASEINDRIDGVVGGNEISVERGGVDFEIELNSNDYDNASGETIGRVIEIKVTWNDRGAQEMRFANFVGGQ